MASVDDRIVSMAFQNAQFEAGVAKTMATLTKLNESLKLTGATKGLQDIEAASQKITLNAPGTAADKLKGKMEFSGAVKGLSDIEGAANRVTLEGAGTAADKTQGRFATMASNVGSALDKLKEKLGFPGADAGFNNIEAASGRVKFAGIHRGLDFIKQKLADVGADKSFATLEGSADRVNFNGLNSAVEGVGTRISAMTVVATAALGTLVSKATTAGLGFTKALSLGPISQGFKEYSTNLNSIQTILANTKFQGSNLKDVNKALAELNTYSDQTIYNFSEMAKNIGTFTAAGVGLKESTQSIKGIANLAALSGSNSQQASTAMYQLSQAIASGRVSLQDWNSVVNAGMGGATFQRALATTAEAMGTISEGALKVDKATGKATINGKSFRESITATPGETSWLTSDVLTKTLGQFTGDLSNAELAAQGFSAAQIKAIQDTAQTAKKAATEVKTIAQAYDVVKESIGSGWAATFQMIFGDFEESKKTFTAFTSTITDFVSVNSDARNKVLGDWKELGGRTALIDGIKNAFDALVSVIKPIKDAFREIFPATTGKQLYDLTVRFRDFTKELKIGPETAENLKRTFAGFFAILSIGKQVLFEIIGVFGKLLGASSEGAGGILNFTGGIGDFLVSIDKAIKEGEGLSSFFDGLTTILSVPLKILGAVAEAIGSLFGGFDTNEADGVGSSLGQFEGILTPLNKIIEVAKEAWSSFGEVLSNLADSLGPAVAAIGGIFVDFGKIVGDALEKADFSSVFQILQTTLIGGIFLTLKKALGGGFNLNLFGGGGLDKLTDTFGVLNKSLVSLQTNVKAGTLAKIALALAALAAAVVALSLIDSDDLAKSMTAIAVGLGQLLGAMALLTKIGGTTAFITMPFIASSMILLAVALNALALAVTILSKLSWEEIAKGLAGVGGSLVAVAAGVKLIPPSIVYIGPALIPIAIALNLLAVAVKVFGSMNLIDLAKGLAGIGGSLAAIGLALKLMPLNLLLIGPGLIAIGVALNLIAVAVSTFGRMSLASIAKGLLGIGGSLTAIGVALKFFPPSIALQAAGLVLVSIALQGIARALGQFGGLSIATIAKGLTAMGASLVVLAYGLKLMSGTFLGAAALFAAASALAILVPVIGILGTMKFGTIVKGLAAIGGALIVIGVAGSAAAPGLTTLGIALIPLGAGTALVGGGVYLLAKALVLLGSDGAKGVAVLIAALTGLVAILPAIIIDFLKGLVQITKSIADIAPQVVDALVKIIISLLDVVIKAAPKMAEAFTALIKAGLSVLQASLPAFIITGFSLLGSLLKGIANNIGMIVTQVAQIVVTFLTALTVQLPRIIASGAAFLIQFAGGLISQMPKLIAAGIEVVVKFITGVAQKIGVVVTAAAELIVKFVNGIASNIGKVIKAGADLIVKFLEGIGSNVKKVIKAAADMMGDFVESAAKAIIGLTNRIARIIINFINALAASIRRYTPELQRAGGNLVDAVVDGALSTISKSGGRVISGITGIFSGALSGVKGLLGIDSPSKVFMKIGEFMMQGTVIGVNSKARLVNRSLETVATDMIDTVVDTLSVVPDLLDGLMDLDPVITPVLDLTSVQAEAKQLSDLTNVTPITAAASYDQAASISAAQEAAQAVTSDSGDTPPITPINFEQNNYSPESLSPAEVYRQTKNQLAQAKNLLGFAS